MDYKIAIPSYKRYETIKDKTLKMLNEYNIDKFPPTILALTFPNLLKGCGVELMLLLEILEINKK